MKRADIYDENFRSYRTEDSASIAQVVERLPEEQGVVGSTPTRSTYEVSKERFRREIMKPNYEIVEDESTNDLLVIRDLGPWDKHKTITNDVENVVKELVANRMLLGNRKLVYYDSECDRGEILVKEGKFAGFGAITGLVEGQ